MNENRNNTTKWLQYLLYVGIAALVNSLLGILGLSGLSRWIGLAVNGVTVYLLFMLAGSNPRYKTAAIFYAIALASGFISNLILGLVRSVCGIVAQYQEYHAHGELIEEQDPKLADKWGSLFGLEIAVTFVGILLTGLVVGVLAAVTNMSEAAITPIVTVFVAVMGVGLNLLYLSYLKRTIALLETEVVE
jgi:hypothetical protein